MFTRKIWSILLSMLAITSVMTSTTYAALTNLDPPGDNNFVIDTAAMLDAQTIEDILAKSILLDSEQGFPIVVVTIESMAAHGGHGMSIETFAQTLFDQWGIGYLEVNSVSWNRGILLVVSEGDREARIELGADWGHEFDSVCQRIMDEQIIPNFKNGDFPGGVYAGVVALDLMGRGLQLPEPVRPKWLFPAITIGLILFIFTVVSLIRRGGSGWAWLFWGVVFSLLGFLLISMLRSSSGGGGGFGGGFSGGGGATGSW